MSDIQRREFLIQAAGALAVMSLVPSLVPAAPLAKGEPLPLGVIGLGRQGRAILGELQKLTAVQVAAACDSDPSRLEAGLRRVTKAEGKAEAQGFGDYREMLEKAKGLKGVIIATPTHLHKDIALAAIAAGLHVYCEAPLAHTVEDCQAIAKAAKGAKTVFQPGLEGRSNPIYQLARTFFRTEAVKDLVSIRAQHFQKNSWRVAASDASREKAMNWKLDKDVSVGLPGELGTHQFDVVNWFRGSEFPTSIRASGSIRVYDDGRQVPDTIHCDLAFKDSVHFQYAATLCNSFEGRNEVFYGSNAAIKLAWSHGWMFKESDSPTMGFEVYANRQQFHNDEGITLIADATKLAEQGKLKEGVGLPNSSLYYALADFVRAVQEGKPPAVSADDGCRASILGILANRAVVSGDAVAVDPALMKGA
jgi:predicted dehydrogenase